MFLKYIDAHTHIQFPEFDADRDQVIKNTIENGVGMINAGADLESSQKAIEIAKKYPNFAWAAVGLHPTDTTEDIASFEKIEKLALDNSVIGIGECGLDFYRDKSPEVIKNQIELFKKHIYLAKSIQKPLIIHCREAFPETLSVLEENKSIFTKTSGIFHFFTGAIEDAKKILDLGFSFTFGGLITYNRSFDEVIKYIPIENILIETDAPFVAPKSHRGERNQPLYVVEVAQAISQIKNINIEETEKILLQNTIRTFSLKI